MLVSPTAPPLTKNISLDTLPSLVILILTQRRPRRTVEAEAIEAHRGVNGEEIQDAGFNMTNARRRSNSSSYSPGLRDFKTKFEQIEAEPVFEEDIHGPEVREEFPETTRVNTESSEASVEEEDKTQKV
ncbi:MAG: hypothetical protein M1818_005136 [Claussenomyces sp. TS43310]|nr:MAG: hypothetical protein M1818_005136 [Claussenomyces sp. TS43310]